MEIPKLYELHVNLKFRAQIAPESLAMLANSTVKTLILWNLVLDPTQLEPFFQGLASNRYIKNLEIWKCDTGMGEKFGVAVGKMLEKNKTLERLVLSHVGLREGGIVGLSKALNINSTLEELTLISVSDVHKFNVATTLQKRMKKSKALSSMFVTYDTMNDNDCEKAFGALSKNFVVKQYREGPRKGGGCCRGCSVM